MSLDNYYRKIEDEKHNKFVENASNSPENTTSAVKKENMESKNILRIQMPNLIELSVKSINGKLFELMSSEDNAELLYDIKNRISKISQEGNQFSVCWFIAWETAKYFKNKDQKYYKEKVEPLLKTYIYLANKAKQDLDIIKFNELYNNLIENIKESKVEYTKSNTDNIGPFRRWREEGPFGRWRRQHI